MPSHYDTGRPDPGHVRENDFYPTPDFVTKALMAREEFIGLTWEPACGQGHMAKVLSGYGHAVFSTELRTDLGFGTGGIDFFSASGQVCQNVITNPPFKHAQKFVEHAKTVATNKVAMLLRLQFLEGQKRYPLFQDKDFPLKVVYVFSRRVTFSLARLSEENCSQTAYAWFVWDKDYQGPTRVEWIDPASHV